MTAFQGIILKEYIQCSRTLNYFSSVVAATVTAMSHNYRFLTKIWYFGMAYHHAKTSCPVQRKKNLVLSRTLQIWSAITQNEQLIDDIFHGEKI